MSLFFVCSVGKHSIFALRDSYSMEFLQIKLMLPLMALRFFKAIRSCRINFIYDKTGKNCDGSAAQLFPIGPHPWDHIAHTHCHPRSLPASLRRQPSHNIAHRPSHIGGFRHVAGTICLWLMLILWDLTQMCG